MRNRSLQLIIGLIFLVIFNFAYAKKSLEPAEKYDAKRVWVAIPAGTLIGYGVGHAFQGRYSDYGWVFTVVDLGALFAAASVFGDCGLNDSVCKDRQNQVGGIAISVWGISRIVQIVDLSMWGYEYNNKFKSSAYLMPSKEGLALTGVISF